MARAQDSPDDTEKCMSQDQVPEIRGGEAPDFTAMKPPGEVPPQPEAGAGPGSG